MSTKYKHGDKVPTLVIAERLEELSDAVVARMLGDSSPMDREFACRIPAEVDRDPDLVLSNAAIRLREMEQKNAELRERIDLASALLEAAPEINPSNYDHGQVCELNDVVNQVHRLLNENSKGGE